MATEPPPLFGDDDEEIVQKEDDDEDLFKSATEVETSFFDFVLAEFTKTKILKAFRSILFKNDRLPPCH